MTTDITKPAATIGDNLPPNAAEALRERLAENFAPLTDRRDELLAAAERAPDAIDNEETAGKITDFIKQLSAAVKATEARRVDEKEPFLASGRTVDGFFKAIIDPLKTAQSKINSVLTVYQKGIADAERKAREESERLAREEAEAARKRAADAEAAMKTEAGLDDAVEAQKRADAAQAAAVAAKKVAEAKAAELARTRGEQGGLSSLRTTWEFEVVDFDAIPLEELRRHLPREGIEKGVRAFVKAGGRELDGVRIFEHHKSIVR